MDLYTVWVFDITRQRFDEELQIASTRWMLSHSTARGRGITHSAMAWLGDRFIQAGQWMKQRHESESASAASHFRIAGKGL